MNTEIIRINYQELRNNSQTEARCFRLYLDICTHILILLYNTEILDFFIKTLTPFFTGRNIVRNVIISHFYQKIKWICFFRDFNHTFTKMCRIFYHLYIIKHFGKFPFMSWMNYSSLSRLYINSWKKYSSFIQMDETWENGQFKKKDQHTSYTTKSTRGTVIILTKWYLSPTAFLKINLSLLGDIRTEYIASCLSTNDVRP